jgi:hypothetical protein
MDPQIKTLIEVAKAFGTDYPTLIEAIDTITLHDLLVLQSALNARAQQIAKDLP